MPVNYVRHASQGVNDRSKWYSTTTLRATLTRSTQRHRQHPLNPLRSSTAISLTVNFITREMRLCKDLSELSRRATINHPCHPDQQAARHSTEADTLRFFFVMKKWFETVQARLNSALLAGIFYIFYIPDIWFGKKLVNYCKLHL